MVEEKHIPTIAENIIREVCANKSGEAAWQAAQHYLLSHATYQHDFALHLEIYQTIYPNWRTTIAPAWFPSQTRIETANLTYWQKMLDVANYPDLHRWSHKHYAEFWQKVIAHLNIRFQRPFTDIADATAGIENIEWLPGAKMNIAESCFNAEPDATAIIYQSPSGIEKMTYGELDKLSNRIANGLVQCGFSRGTAIAIDMFMNVEAVAIYLGIIKAGCMVVSIVDSFAAAEVQSRLKIADAQAIFVHDVIIRNNKVLPLYEKILSNDLPRAIVIPTQTQLNVELRNDDLNWHEFLSDNEDFNTTACSPNDYTNILFSSGTTGTPA